jgi:hypothetical protein
VIAGAQFAGDGMIDDPKEVTRLRRILIEEYDFPPGLAEELETIAKLDLEIANQARLRAAKP